MNGITAYVCVGKWAGFHVRWDAGPRVTLGWIGFAIVGVDIEVTIRDLAELAGIEIQ